MGSNSDASRAFPFRHGFEAVKMGGKRGAAGMGWNEEIADSRKDTDKPLQTSWCRKPCIIRSRQRKGR
jgi:hypothetical protein